MKHSECSDGLNYDKKTIYFTSTTVQLILFSACHTKDVNHEELCRTNSSNTFRWTGSVGPFTVSLCSVAMVGRLYTLSTSSGTVSRRAAISNSLTIQKKKIRNNLPWIPSISKHIASQQQEPQQHSSRTSDVSASKQKGFLEFLLLKKKKKKSSVPNSPSRSVSTKKRCRRGPLPAASSRWSSAFSRSIFCGKSKFGQTQRE